MSTGKEDTTNSENAEGNLYLKKHPHSVHQGKTLCSVAGKNEGESNENLKYFSTRNLLNTKGTH